MHTVISCYSCMWTVWGTYRTLKSSYSLPSPRPPRSAKSRGGTSPIDGLCLALERLRPQSNTSEVQDIYSGIRGVLSPERDHIIIIRTTKVSILTGAISLRVIQDILITPRTKLGPYGIVLAICLFIVFAPAVLVNGYW